MKCYDVKEVGSGPVFTAICRQLKIRHTANQVLPWDAKQCLLDPGTNLVALINNISTIRDPFLSRRRARMIEPEVMVDDQVDNKQRKKTRAHLVYSRPEASHPIFFKTFEFG